MPPTAVTYSVWDRVWALKLISNGVTRTFYRDGTTQVLGLRITFSIQLGIAFDPNTAKISIYGLGPNDREMAVRRGTSIELYAGYKATGARLIFKGRVLFGLIERPGADWVVNLESVDGFSRKAVAFTLPAGTAKSAILERLRAEMDGVDKGPIKDQPTGTLTRPLVFAGNVEELLREYSEDHGLETSIQNQRLQSHGENSDTGEGIILLTPDTGLEGSPIRTRAGLGNLVFASPGVQVSMRLRPELRPGRKLEIHSDVLAGGQGTFKTFRVSHEGDSWGDAWTTGTEAWDY